MKSSDVLRNMKCPHRLSSLKPWSPAGVHVGKVVEPLVGFTGESRSLQGGLEAL